MYSTIPRHFPYTTLFRSGARQAEQGAPGRPAVFHQGANGSGTDRGAEPEKPDRGRGGGAVGQFLFRRRLQLDRPDRKSTRLNSSHTVISYAVFCLKKKNV